MSSFAFKYDHQNPPPGVFTHDDLYRPTTLYCDVAVVGSGAGGATAAAELAEAGYDVVILEEGSYYGTNDFNARSSEMIRTLYRDGGATIAIGNPPVFYQEGSTVGGSTVVNGGMSWRTPEKILARWSREDKLRNILIEDMDPFFERVERRLHVRHQDPESIGRDNALLKAGADAKNWDVIPNLRNQAHCVGSNNCAFGCPTGAKQSALITYVPRALHFGARIYSNVKVKKVTFKGTRATGLVGNVVHPNGTLGAPVRVHANLVISACGAIHTPALLHRSRYRSKSKLLGGNLSLHPNGKLIALFDEDIRGWEGVHQAFQVREFQDDGFLFAAVNVPPGVLAMGMHQYGEGLGEVMADYPRMLIAGMLLEDTALGRVRVDPLGNPTPFYQLNDFDAEQLVRGTALLCELIFAAGARKIFVPFGSGGELNSPDDIPKLFEEKISKDSLELFTVHMMGTAKMGATPESAVTDDFGHVFGAEQLVVCDASLFPSPIGINPAETIHALATRNVAHLLENHSKYLL